MVSRSRFNLFELLSLMGFSIAILAASAGCMPSSRMSVRTERCRIEVQLDPAAHHIVGRAVLDLAATDLEDLPPGEPVALELMLHPDLKITEASAARARITRRLRDREPRMEDGEVTGRRHTMVLAEPVDALTLFVDFEGELFQDVAAGEKPGEIHNLTMKAHIAEEGIYLGGGYWYPQPIGDDGAEPALTDYTLVVGDVPGMELVAGAEHDARLSEQTGALAWRSPYPVDEMVLVGGPHKVHRLEHHGIAINLHLKPSQAEHAAGLMDTVRRNLDRYEPLIGPYPGREFSIVDNFFSSGFAFPMFTLLSSAVIDMGTRSQTAHGYIDHEILHSWWGNGIFVDPRDGNWCEALASYGANYYGYVLDGDDRTARRKRRNYSHFLSRIKEKHDKPLGTYGLDDGCGRGIAYHKGAAVFHMLARKIGQENFWQAMRRLTEDYVGRYASWDDIRRICEEVSGTSLDVFFQQWVRRGGAPAITIDRASYNSAEQALTLSISQTEPTFQIDLPVRINHADGSVDISVPISRTFEEITVPVEVIPLTVEVDPDYHVFRKVPLERIVPTTASTRYGKAFTCVLPAGEIGATYSTIKSIFEASFEEGERATAVAGQIEDGALAERCLLILGEAGRDPYVSAFLSAIEFPIRWIEGGFMFEGTEYTDENDAVLCTASQPGVPGGGVTLLYGNSEDALPKAINVGMYDRSLIIFSKGRPTLRRDFEAKNLVQVEE